VLLARNRGPLGAAIPTEYGSVVTEKFGIESLRLVAGWSMAAMQRFHWASMYPKRVERILPFLGGRLGARGTTLCLSKG
jgi:homoserine acetyltransferase